MITFELKQEQYNNLKVFLARVDLKGAEVPAFIDIMQALEQAVIQEDGK